MIPIRLRLRAAAALLVLGALAACSPAPGEAPPAAEVLATPTAVPATPAPASTPDAIATSSPTAEPTITPSAVATATPSTAPTATSPVTATAGGTPAGLSLVGALRLEPFNNRTQGDVAAYKELAFVGKGRGPCPGTGVDIIDISNPAAPTKLADTDDYADTAMEDMGALRIGARDVLAVGLQACGADPATATMGLELVDITDPRNPERLGLFPAGAHGVHELDVTTTPDGRALALLAVPDLEVETATEEGSGGTGDLLIVDISDPAQPVQLAEWGVLDEPALGPEVYAGARRGGDSRTQLHSVRADARGTRAYLSYWDAGVIILDISNPERPVYLGRTSYGPGDEGNAHSVADSEDGTLLIQADEDTSPFGLVISSAALTETREVASGGFARRIEELPGREMAGEVVHVGRGCPADSPAAGDAEDAYLADPSGKIALVERGRCEFAVKVARAQQAGATGVIVYNSADSEESLIAMAGEPVVTLPDGASISISIPAVFATRATGEALLAAPGVEARVASEFNGWGFLRFFDIHDPAAPVALGTFATPNTLDESAAGRGLWSVHNPELAGTMLFASWYNEGVRAIDISDPSAPREVASWTGEGAPEEAPPVLIWSVVPHGDLLVVSDINFGLYILRFQP
ncbi:MAG TPA: PA domain-containing protein [Herpetosiphonaceae bacterium]|nr:PA domain-containing protein [Herpetosiphonaceae bacterium]